MKKANKENLKMDKKSDVGKKEMPNEKMEYVKKPAKKKKK